VTDGDPGRFELLSRLLCYPDLSYRVHLARSAGSLADSEPDAARLLNCFAEATRDLSTARLQELFTQTFDLNPVCSLEVGWHLFGEEYARGTFLVSMRGLLRDNGLQENSELPDHLTNLLPLLDRLEEKERNYFIEKYLSPAIAKMLAPFEEKKSPYEDVMRALVQLIENARNKKPAEVAHG